MRNCPTCGDPVDGLSCPRCSTSRRMETPAPKFDPSKIVPMPDYVRDQMRRLKTRKADPRAWARTIVSEHAKGSRVSGYALALALEALGKPAYDPTTPTFTRLDPEALAERLAIQAER